ncbi:MAG: glycosyltransferase [Ignavibacteriales bacterium]|nr:glycosyltransferase [Ignavibacteriales bacterium]
MATSPRVFIIILSWNGKRDTIECLQSFEKVKYQNKKIIVVDNASSDGTVDEVTKMFSHVEVIVNNSNLRFAGGNNVGTIPIASGTRVVKLCGGKELSHMSGCVKLTKGNTILNRRQIIPPVVVS